MDIQMPHMNGYEATKNIRGLPDGRCRIPIIAMTANAFEEDRKRAIESGMNGYVTKPIKIEELISTIKKILKSWFLTAGSSKNQSKLIDKKETDIKPVSKERKVWKKSIKNLLLFLMVLWYWKFVNRLWIKNEDNLTKKKLLTFFCKKCNLLIKNSMEKSKPENGLLFSYQLN